MICSEQPVTINNQAYLTRRRQGEIDQKFKILQVCYFSYLLSIVLVARVYYLCTPHIYEIKHI